MLSMFPCERLQDIEWYDINGSEFANCTSCQPCVKLNDTAGNYPSPVFWNRLQVTRGSLVLTGIQKGDDRLRIGLRVHVKPSAKSVGKDVEIQTESVHEYTVRIFVIASGRLQGNNSDLVFNLKGH